MANLFEDCFTNSRGSNVKVKTIKKYADKCDQVTYGCDEMKLISQDDYLQNCPCFQKIVFNGTNSKDVLLDCDKFDNCVFDSISITLDVFQSCLLYKVIGVYEGNSYDLVDFRFHNLDSQKTKVNGYKSDILIHGKAWRLQVVSGGKFNIYDFLINLVTYDTMSQERYIVAFGEYYITRFDFRIDFFHSIDIPHLKYEDVYAVTARKGVDNLVIDRHSKKIYTGRTAGNRKDKYIYTRMYQKQVEALDKGQGDLYSDYLSYNGKVRRLEFEFLSKFTTYPGKISFSDEFIHHKLTQKIFQYLGLAEKNGYFTKPKSKIEASFNQLSIHKQKRIITQTMNNVSRLHKAGINPYIIVTKAIKDCDPLFDDPQVLETYFDSGNYMTDSNFDNILNKIESSKITTKELYDKIYMNQLGIDL